ncbi:Uncharacterised protein [Collinsella intestinalis]|nr:Uncharacterised protein [Collinsella intestinalis]
MKQCIIYALRQSLFINADTARTVSLRVKVNNQNLTALLTKCSCQIHSRGRLTHAALLVDDCNGMKRFRAFRALYVAKSHITSCFLLFVLHFRSLVGEVSRET